MRRAEEMQSMEATLWSNLPSELMEWVLARLPFQALLRFRSVCKSWNCLLSSPTFLHEVYQAPSQEETWFLSGAVTQNKLAFYAPSLKKWHITTVPTINMVNFDDTVVPEATKDGLVCLTKYARQEDWTMVTSELFVWNPVTTNCRQLPDTLRTCSWPGLCVAGMLVDPLTKQYKVVTVGTYCFQELPAGLMTVTEIYDSATDAWKVCESSFPHDTVSRLTRWNVCCNWSVYSIMRKPYSIVAFDLKTELWREIEVPIADVECPNLVELNNRLFMVAGVSSNDSIRIWELVEHFQQGKVQWIEVDRMPSEILNLVTTSSHSTIRHWRCVGSGDSLFFRGWGSQDVLMYSISERSWSWLPSCSLDNNRYYYAWNGLCFKPRLDVPVGRSRAANCHTVRKDGLAPQCTCFSRIGHTSTTGSPTTLRK